MKNYTHHYEKDMYMFHCNVEGAAIKFPGVPPNYCPFCGEEVWQQEPTRNTKNNIWWDKDR